MNEELNKSTNAPSKIDTSKGTSAQESILMSEQGNDVNRDTTGRTSANYLSIEKTWQMSYSTGHINEAVQTVNINPGALPKSLFQGEIIIGDIHLLCYVLNNGKRVIAQRGLVYALTAKHNTDLIRYFRESNLSAYFDLSHITEQTVDFIIPGSPRKAIGHEGALLIEICRAYLRARDDQAITKRQIPLVKKADAIVRSCVNTSISDLIDKATGYQKVNEENTIRSSLKACIAEKVQEWEKMFPDDFWSELARLENVENSPGNRLTRWGNYVTAFVYDAVDDDFANELRSDNPYAFFSQDQNQWLKNYNRKKIRKHLIQVTSVMKTCKDLADFKDKFSYEFYDSPS
jgi:P63C domain